jgi:hypothetical protein
VSDLKELVRSYTDSDINLLVRCAYVMRDTDNLLAAYLLGLAIQLKVLQVVNDISKKIFKHSSIFTLGFPLFLT